MSNIVPKLKSSFLPLLIAASILWSIYDWSKFNVVLARLHEFGFVALLLLLSELAFISGAILMAIEAGEAIGESQGFRHHLRHARRNLKRAMAASIQSHRFATGFWLNFAGAVTTTLILASGVLVLMPVASWGLLVLLAVDLVATFSWRIPLHLKRRRLGGVEQ